MPPSSSGGVVVDGAGPEVDVEVDEVAFAVVVVVDDEPLVELEVPGAAVVEDVDDPAVVALSLLLPHADAGRASDSAANAASQVRRRRAIRDDGTGTRRATAC
jgi:hypothetical protein